MSETSTRDSQNRISALSDAARSVLAEQVANQPELAPALAFLWLDPTEVAAEAGLDPSVFDELWPLQDNDSGTASDTGTASDAGDRNGTTETAFTRFLADISQRSRITRYSPRPATSGPQSDMPLHERMRVNAPFPEPDEAEWLSHRLALASSALSEHYRADYAAFIAESEYVCSLMLYRFGLRVRKPFTLHELTVSLADALETPWFQRVLAITDSKAVRMFRPTPDSEMKPWPLDSIVAWTIISALTEPDDDLGEPTDVSAHGPGDDPVGDRRP